MEFLFALLALAIVLGLPLLSLAIALRAKARADEVRAVLRRIEQQLAQQERAELDVVLPAPGLAPAPPPPDHALPPWASATAPTAGPAAAGGGPAPAWTAAAPAGPPAPAAERRRPRVTRSAPRVRLPRTSGDVESLLGGQVLNRAGAIALVVAVIFLLKHAFDHRWLAPGGRIALGLTAGVAITLWGMGLHRRGNRIFGQGITGAGLAIQYATLYVAHALYGLVPAAAALPSMIAVSAEGAAVAIALRAQSVAVLALAGGFLAPLLAGGGHSAWTLALYLIAVALLAMLLGARQGWAWLDAVALGGTNLAWADWADDDYQKGGFAAAWGAQALTFALFVLAPYARRLARRKPFVVGDLALWAGAGGAFFLWSAWLLRVDQRHGLGWVAVALATAYLTQAVLVRGNELARPARAYEALLAMALTFAVIAVPAELDRVAVTFAWVAQGNLLLWLGLRSGMRWMRNGSFVVLIVALGHMLFVDFPDLSRYETASLVVQSAVLLLCSGGVAAAGWIAHRAGLRVAGVPVGRVLRITGGAAGLLVITAALAEHGNRQARALWAHPDMSESQQRAASEAAQRIHRWVQAAISVAWAVYGAAASVLGFVRKTAPARWFGLTVFGLLVGKLLLVDLSGLAAIYRVATLFVAAVALLAVSWLYTRRKTA